MALFSKEPLSHFLCSLSVPLQELDGAGQYHTLSWMGATFPAGTAPPTPPVKDALTVTVGKCCLRFVSPSPAPVFLALFFFCRMFTFHLHKAEALISSRIEQAGGDMCV